MSRKEEIRRENVCNFFISHPNWSRSMIVKHFVEMGVSRRTIYNILATYNTRKTTKRKLGSGKTCSLSDLAKRSQLKKLTVGKVAKSYRELGRKFDCDGKTVKKYLLKMKINKRSRKMKPAVSEAQEVTQKQRLKKLVGNTFRVQNDVTCIMDDESYFTLDGNEWQGKHYFEKNDAPVSSEVKYVEHKKFPKKVLLWLAISPNGMSEPVFFESGLAVHGDIYVERCLPKVQDFIKQKHRGKNVVFWPDLASSHYAKRTLEAMEALNIPYVPKCENPPNVPQLRPIEDFWANLKRQVYANNFRPKNVKSLMNKIKLELRKIPTTTFSTAMAKVPQNCRKAARRGVIFFCIIYLNIVLS